MRLFHDPLSTTSRPLLTFIAEHDLDIDLPVVSILAGEQRTEAFSQINPACAVPALQMDGWTLTESFAILKYLANLVKSEQYPTELRARAQVDEVSNWLVTTLNHYFCFGLVYPQILPGAERLSPVALQKAEDLVKPKFQHLEKHILGTKPYLCGTQITLADHIGASKISLAYAIDFDLSAYPNVENWLKRLRARPAWKQAYEAFDALLHHRAASQLQRKTA